MHSRNHIVLEDEPRYLDPSKLKGFRVTALHARQSILSHNGILWARGEGCAEQGEEVYDLGVQDDAGTDSPNVSSTVTMEGSHAPTAGSLWSQLHTPPNEEVQQGVSAPNLGHADVAIHQDDISLQDTDFFYPFLDSEMFNTGSDGEYRTSVLTVAGRSALGSLVRDQ
ncbi:hypothetical protein PMZ80_003975 [Knufia obscura]|uniref:Uncharacterized protein n=1 Tax=Knufia obscura TaxID=1635080 RepID=A0ABR0RQS1_9EURO|nr:hypothetical protein PMZ80_003975 [Knufia obscura]